MLLKILAPFLSVTNALAESIFEPHSFVLKGGRGTLHSGGQQWPLSVWVRETADVEGSLGGIQIPAFTALHCDGECRRGRAA